MSAVSIKVMPASSAAWMVAMAWDSSGNWLSLFMDMGMAPRPMAVTVKGPSVRVCMAENLSGADQRFSLRTAASRCRRSSSTSGRSSGGSLRPRPSSSTWSASAGLRASTGPCG